MQGEPARGAAHAGRNTRAVVPDNALECLSKNATDCVCLPVYLCSSTYSGNTVVPDLLRYGPGPSPSKGKTHMTPQYPRARK